MSKTYDWYDLVEADEPLEQGDLLKGCPCFIPDYAAVNWDKLPSGAGQVIVPGKVRTYDTIILSQSCDLADGDLDNVIVCPHWSPEEMIAAGSGFKRDWLPSIRKGHMPTYHMLQACDLAPKQQGIHIVDFGAAYPLPYDYIKQFARAYGNRVRLNPPYREHLSQAYARYFMRVGLPQGITLDKPAKK